MATASIPSATVNVSAVSKPEAQQKLSPQQSSLARPAQQVISPAVDAIEQTAKPSPATQKVVPAPAQVVPSAPRPTQQTVANKPTAQAPATSQEGATVTSQRPTVPTSPAISVEPVQPGSVPSEDTSKTETPSKSGLTPVHAAGLLAGATVVGTMIWAAVSGIARAARSPASAARRTLAGIASVATAPFVALGQLLVTGWMLLSLPLAGAAWMAEKASRGRVRVLWDVYGQAWQQTSRCGVEATQKMVNYIAPPKSA